MKKIILLLLFVSSVLQAQVKIGEILPTFALKNANDEEVSSKSFENKFVLIDFWASWCAPCRKGNKELVKLHKKIDVSRFEIVGISVDKDASKWLKAIEKDNIQFTQLIDPNGFDAPTAILFGVEELPSQYLFDNNGILIAINPTEEEINNLLKK
ncbi:TlpA disulfide reductase family protein [uncultured Flavobacterium sp.]|uniref:TlpA family protein disulfide reductase n=1 Tax=uncultured Flavobacterium sp. TaxID=165435 RepID=UPI0030C8B07D